MKISDEAHGRLRDVLLQIAEENGLEDEAAEDFSDHIEEEVEAYRG